MPTKPQYGGRTMPTVGMVGQRLALRRRVVLKRTFVGDDGDPVSGSGLGSYTVLTPDWYDIYIFGPGGPGGSSAGVAASHGGGGGAAMATVFMLPGQVVSYLVGRGDGGLGNSTVTLPDGRVLTGGQGGQGGAGYVPGGTGGVGSGGDLNRRGGAGFGWTNPDSNANTNDGVPVLGSDGEWGGRCLLGPEGGGNGYGPGGAGGFSNIFSELIGDGASSGSYGQLAGTAPGGGGMGNVSGNPAGYGGAGCFIIVGPR